jgi:hypothetical protein
VKDLQLTHEGPTYRVATWRNVVIAIVREEITMPFVDAIIDAHRLLLQAGHPGVLVMTIGERGTRAPSVALQKRSAGHAKAVESTLLGSAVVSLDEGFWLAALRSAITAIGWLVPGWKVKFEPDLGRGVMHLQSVAGETAVWAKDLSRAIDEARRFLDGSAVGSAAS